jgi:hypothetical protein
MHIPDSFNLLAGVPLVIIVPPLVQLAKGHGLPARFAGLAAIICATVLLALASLGLNGSFALHDLARWLIGGIVYGLAAVGLYSQRDLLGRSRPAGVADDRAPMR